MQRRLAIKASVWKSVWALNFEYFAWSRLSLLLEGFTYVNQNTSITDTFYTAAIHHYDWILHAAIFLQ